MSSDPTDYFGDGDDPDEDDWYDPEHGYEPDEVDYEIARQYAEHEQHCEDVHRGADCDCRPPWWRRAWWWLLEKRRRSRERRIPYDDEPPF